MRRQDRSLQLNIKRAARSESARSANFANRRRTGAAPQKTRSRRTRPCKIAAERQLLDFKDDRSRAILESAAIALAEVLGRYAARQCWASLNRSE